MYRFHVFIKFVVHISYSDYGRALKYISLKFPFPETLTFETSQNPYRRTSRAG